MSPRARPSLTRLGRRASFGYMCDVSGGGGFAPISIACSRNAQKSSAELQAEAVHLGPARAWVVAHGDRERVDRTLYSLWQFYFTTGRWGEAEQAFRQAVERLREGERDVGSSAAAAAADAPVLCRLLALHAYTLHLRNQNEQALAVAGEAIALTPQSGAKDGLSAAEMLCGIVLALTGSPIAARPHVERALALCRQHHQDYPGEMLRDVWWSCEHLLTQICLTLGDLAEAGRHIHCALELGDSASAGQRFAQLGPATNPPPLPEVKSFALLTQALLALQAGEPEQAMIHAEAARQLQGAPGNPYEGAATLIVMGHAAAAAARWAEAQAAYQGALSPAETLNIRDIAAEGHAELANVAACTGDSVTTLAHAEAILVLLADQSRVGLDEPFITYLACYRVLAAADDVRARGILTQGHARLLEYARHICDEALRQSFLENVAEHRELRQLGAHIGTH